ncbi:hypothetical protein D3C73_1019350 [compost metagenome]
MHFPVRMENSFWMLIIAAIVAQNDIHLIAAILASTNNRSYCVVRNLLPINLAECMNISCRIAVYFPLLINLVGCLKQSLLILSV